MYTTLLRICHIYVPIFFAGKIQIYSMNSQEVKSNPNIIKKYIEVLRPPDDHYNRQTEPPTRRYRRSLTIVSLTLLMTVRKHARAPKD
jgi:hypothetical protein